MSAIKPPNNKGKKPSYHSVPMKRSSVSPSKKTSGKSGGKPMTKYNVPKKKQVPAAVIVTNILMVCVILSICGVVFAIAYNNIQYDKADAEKSSKKSSVVTSTVPVSSQSSESSTVSNVSSVSSAGGESTESGPNGESSTPINTGEFDPEFFKNDLFIGDSIFTGLYLYSYIDRQNVAAAVGYTAYGAQVNPFDEDYYKGSATAYAKSRQPARIIIMLGSNSLSPQTLVDDYADFINGYRGLLNTLKRDCPNSEILVISVPPITANSSMASYSGVTNTIIDGANAKIKSLCGDLAVNFYDLNSELKDSSGYFSKDYAAVDGMHFLGSTYPIVLSGIQNKLTNNAN